MNVTKFSRSRRSAVSAKRVAWTLMIQVHPSRAHTATAAFELALRSSVIAGTNTQIRLFYLLFCRLVPIFVFEGETLNVGYTIRFLLLITVINITPGESNM